jgi:hypothetical protein
MEDSQKLLHQGVEQQGEAQYCIVPYLRPITKYGRMQEIIMAVQHSLPSVKYKLTFYL